MDTPPLSPESIEASFLEHGFVCTGEVSTALFLAERLGKPLLLEGPPGVGKTEIGKMWALVHGAELVRLQCYEGLDEAKALYEWSYGKQMLYAQLLREKTAEIVADAPDLGSAIRRLKGQADEFFSRDFLLARPLLAAITSTRPVVLLVDEVDRADEEFEAFLLELLSDAQVSIPELGTIRAERPPRVILTSNDSRELSDALRRRCLYAFIDYPDAHQELRIVESRVPGASARLREQLVRFTQTLRRSALRKQPGSAETVDWALALVAVGAESLSSAVLRRTLGALLKNREDLEQVLADLPSLPLMIEGLERFVVELRRAGIEVSPAEWLDALRAAVEISIADRENFRRALRSCLVKRAGQRSIFDETFDRFFAAPSRPGGRERPGAGGEGTGGQARGRGLAPQRRPRPLDPERVSPAAVRRAQDKKAAARLAPLAACLEELRHGSRTRHGRLRHVLTAPRSERPAGAAVPAAWDLTSRLEVAAESEIAAEVPRIVRRIRLSTGRRRRRSSRGRFYLRRLFRESLAHGGVPFVLPRRRARPRRVSVVLLVDVSWSVARAAGLFLSIAGEFVARADRSRLLVFVDRVCDATAQVDAWLARRSAPRPATAGAKIRMPSRPGAGIVRGGVSFAECVSSLPGLDLRAPSDYGRSFHRLLRSRHRPVGRNTLLLVLGDGRTNRFDAQGWAFEEIAERCGTVIWLVPEEVARWGTGDSALGDYLPHVDVAVEAHDLAGLSRGAAELVRRLAP